MITLSLWRQRFFWQAVHQKSAVLLLKYIIAILVLNSSIDIVLTAKAIEVHCTSNVQLNNEGCGCKTAFFLSNHAKPVLYRLLGLFYNFCIGYHCVKPCVPVFLSEFC